MIATAEEIALNSRGRECGWSETPESNCGQQAHWDRMPRREDPLQAEVCCKCWRIRRRRGLKVKRVS